MLNRIAATQNYTTKEGFAMRSVAFKALAVGLASLMLLMAGPVSAILAGPSHTSPGQSGPNGGIQFPTPFMSITGLLINKVTDYVTGQVIPPEKLTAEFTFKDGAHPPFSPKDLVSVTIRAPGYFPESITDFSTIQISLGFLSFTFIIPLNAEIQLMQEKVKSYVCIIIINNSKKDWTKEEIEEIVKKAQEVWSSHNVEIIVATDVNNDGKVDAKDCEQLKRDRVKEATNNGLIASGAMNAVTVTFIDQDNEGQDVKNSGGAIGDPDKGTVTMGGSVKKHEHGKDKEGRGRVLAHELGHVLGADKPYKKRGHANKGGNLPGPNDKNHKEEYDERINAHNPPVVNHNLMEDGAPGTHLKDEQRKEVRKSKYILNICPLW
jgi:hypothetical protein